MKCLELLPGQCWPLSASLMASCLLPCFLQSCNYQLSEDNSIIARKLMEIIEKMMYRVTGQKGFP